MARREIRIQGEREIIRVEFIQLENNSENDVTSRGVAIQIQASRTAETAGADLKKSAPENP